MVFNVFISSSVRDFKIIEELKSTLKRYGITVISPLSVTSYGQQIYEQIKSQIQMSDCFLAIIGIGGERSNSLNFEMGIATALNKPIIPIVEKNAILPSDLRSRKYIILDKDNPRVTYEQAAEYVGKLKIEKEQRNSIGGLITLGLGLLLLGAIFGSD